MCLFQKGMFLASTLQIKKETTIMAGIFFLKYSLKKHYSVIIVEKITDCNDTPRKGQKHIAQSNALGYVDDWAFSPSYG